MWQILPFSFVFYIFRANMPLHFHAQILWYMMVLLHLKTKKSQKKNKRSKNVLTIKVLEVTRNIRKKSRREPFWSQEKLKELKMKATF